MRYIIIAVLITFSVAACTSHHHRTRTVKIEDDHKIIKIEDDGSMMRIKAEINNKEEPVDYDQSFNVKAMTDGQKETLKNHILDSLYKIR